MPKSITFNIVTLFPDIIKPHLSFLPISRAIEKGLVKINFINPRDFAIDEKGTVDDKPYGGGVGMVLRIEPFYDALKSIGLHNKTTIDTSKNKIIALTASGKTYNQKYTRELAECDTITFLCGRYEGLDHRIETELSTESISIGNYVLSGGELPTLVIIESIVRLIPDILEKPEATQKESYSDDECNLVEAPQYTRPEEFNGAKVPEVLLSGNHAQIEKYRDQKPKA